MAIIHWKKSASPEVAGAWDSWSLFDRLNEDWDRFFDRSVPALDVLETDDGCTIWADLPGLGKKDIELSVSGSMLSLKGEKAPQNARGKDRESTTRNELWSGRFERTVALPDSVDPEKISAELKDGVLRITVAKRAAWKTRQIAIAQA